MLVMTTDQKPLIVAVSGGVDSVVMLDMLVASGPQPLIVAHVDHGIRDDSGEDVRFVEQLARRYEVSFEATELHLGKHASEDTARNKRYEWLERVRKSYGADAIATAHHQDDVIETIIINLIRGTGWRGLCSLRQTSSRYRPLIEKSKAEIIEYALSHDLSWREDSTNDTPQYFRNRIRALVTSRLSPDARKQFLNLYSSQLILRNEIELGLQSVLQTMVTDEEIDRYPLIMMEENVAIETLREWLGQSLEQARFQNLLHFAKTAKAGSKWSLDSGRFIMANQRTLIVSPSRD